MVGTRIPSFHGWSRANVPFSDGPTPDGQRRKHELTRCFVMRHQHNETGSSIGAASQRGAPSNEFPEQDGGSSRFESEVRYRGSAQIATRLEAKENPSIALRAVRRSRSKIGQAEQPRMIGICELNAETGLANGISLS